LRRRLSRRGSETWSRVRQRAGKRRQSLKKSTKSTKQCKKKNGIQNIKHNNHEQVGLAIRNLKM
jgi:hypothetical protein